MVLVRPPRIVPWLSFLSLLLILYIVVQFRSQLHEENRVPTPPRTRKAGYSSKETHVLEDIHKPVKHDPLDFSVPIEFKPGLEKPPGVNYSMAVVFPATRFDDTRWIHQVAQFANPIIYEVDNPRAEHKVPVNKGRESMVSIANGCHRYLRAGLRHALTAP
jgi:hypothetical protein